ncbi:S1 family peptidase [Acholeplasma granularum]|uniref:S1 family peptidase n=1 Tax=Acholeplasma granularum TaxID=264635 RepID=UPI00046F5B7D|nr:serine protease [Acholeplasma granularum]
MLSHRVKKLGLKKNQTINKRNKPIHYNFKYPKIMESCRQIILEDGSYGTGFIFKYNNQYFIITAAHVIKEKYHIKKKKISIKKIGGTHMFYNAHVYFHPDEDVDICIIKLPENDIPDSYLTFNFEPVTIGETYYMFGFPGAIDITYEYNEEKGSYPIPVIRKGIASNFQLENDISHIILDAISVPGFSGSPIVRIEDSENFYVVGVLIESNNIFNSIYDSDNIELDYYVHNTSGFSRGIHIAYAIDIIEHYKLDK